MRTLLKFFLHYLNPLNTFLGLLVASSALSCALYFSFKDLFGISLSNEIFWPAALGVTGFSILKFIETRSKRYNTLCHLEVELNQAMDGLSNLISTLQNMIQHFIPILLPHDLPCMSIDHVKEVGRLDVKNKLADLLCDFRRINQDWNNLIDFGKEHNAVIKNPNHPQHQEARIAGTQLLHVILQRAKTTLKLVEDTLVLVRIYSRMDKPFFKFGQPFVWPCELMSSIENEKRQLFSEKQSHQ